MGTITYYVAVGYDRDQEGELVALDLMEAGSFSIAISRARSLASSKAGAIAFSRTGDPDVAEFQDAVVLFKAGEVPEDALAE